MAFVCARTPLGLGLAAVVTLALMCAGCGAERSGREGGGGARRSGRADHVTTAGPAVAEQREVDVSPGEAFEFSFKDQLVAEGRLGLPDATTVRVRLFDETGQGMEHRVENVTVTNEATSETVGVVRLQADSRWLEGRFASPVAFPCVVRVGWEMEPGTRLETVVRVAGPTPKVFE